ncbi:PREDICTED: LOW QUALITY PROTEIN: adenylate cyclase type 10-like [Polistes dominula]|uniref:LOW QUALITY PROTEIN: adenylate cyclase type 10-like n=1 Tax=Polistes dominula TaxID=743375 RepID=A0ABM1JDL3_POLDO|nr:PREDICTED: LOW QUALITY PROTEIN: adenylate cyclase type 10-like [Polistes dominula]
MFKDSKERSVIDNNNIVLKIENHTRIYASMCPDEILDDYDNYEIRKYLTTLMLGDISGFTDFAEKYTRTGKGGASKLTEILNSYIGAMVQEILSHNGDLLKFSGDAFIVMWKLKKNANMRDLATMAIQTACIIQKHFGAYETDVGITLKVKLAIASGKTYFTCIGDPKKMSHYIIIGKPVWEVKNAERLCKGGDILVALSAWQWVNPIEYIYETLPDGLHTLIIACSTMWYTLKGTYTYDDGKIITKQSLTFYVYNINEKETSSQESSTVFIEKLVTNSTTVLMNLSGSLMYSKNMEIIDFSLFSVRPKIIKVSKAQLKDALRSYMLKPVIRSVEMDEPLEYLTEMRQVVIVFVNAVTSEMKKRQFIKLVDAAYKLVCRIVDRMQGCVNKTSLFDKDLTFLCIFGLRGEKHELESQIGLKCAYRLRIGLKELACITSVTVGVTTGMTYCGVVGHILRREYTVIGMTVNKAARLMMGYNNKVICDRESFLHSRLEVSHFKLQEPKYFKGITDVGPVYEFEEQVRYKVSEMVWNKYPLLGRDNEMNFFRHLLANLVEYLHFGNDSPNKPQYNTLIIRGEPRIGKTRLLDEMVLNIPSGIPLNYISLVSTDIQVDHTIFFPFLIIYLKIKKGIKIREHLFRTDPYTLVHLIFSLPLKFSLTSTPKDREEKLIRLLGNVRYPEYLCALNQVFNVSFPMTKQYRSFMELEKQKILEQLLINLTKKCFPKFWVIIIDDFEYADKESLNFFDIFVKTNMFLFIISVGGKVGAEYRHHTLLERAYVMELQGIDKWYHIGIVCQVLNVIGISPELEKLIQNRSLGNPGWIESYLMTLMQSGNLAIITVTRREAETMGYVLPNVKMLKRHTLNNIFKNTGPVREDRWEMYETSYTSNVNLSSNEILHQSDTDLSKHEEISVAFSKTLDSFSIKNTNIDMTMDVIILKLFDSLTPLDQFLLKCASVLGIFVNRKMLESITEISKKDTAVAIRKLFEIRIFECGMGDFSKNVGPIIYYRNIRNHVGDIGVKCRCINLVIPEELSNMPKYASCGLMRFKMALFRDTTYGLLTENQKIELHNKALKFLQHNTRRCEACGKGHFTNLLDINIFSEVEGVPIHWEYPLNLKRQLHNVNSRILPRIKSVLSNKNSLSYLNVFKKPERKPARTFSNLDFTNCQCNLILLTVYTQMVEHCYGIGKNDKTLIAILGYAEICIENQNIPQARKLLDEADKILQQMFDPNKNEVIRFLYLTAKIQTLQGKCYFNYGHTSEAEKSLNKAMKTLGYNFPRMNITTHLKTAFQLKKLKLLLFCPRKRKRNIEDDDDVRKYANQLAYCLAQMFQVYKAKGMKKQARLAAIWALNTARPNNDFFILSTCYTNMLITAHVYRIKYIHTHELIRNIIISLEKESIDLCNEETRIIEYQHLKVIVELYAGIFFSRWIRGQIKKALDIGFIVMKLAKSIDLTYIQCIVLPQLVHLLMISCRHSEVVSILRDLEFISKNNIDKSGRTWYYAMCADVQLDVGFTILSYENCKKYYLKEGESMFSLRNPEAERRYFTSMWLWCVRNQEWEASNIWMKTNFKINTSDEDIVAATITDLKKLEGLLISYVYYVNKRDVKAIHIMADIKVSFKNVKKMISIVKIAIPRYVFIKAYYHMVRGHKRKAIKILQKTKKISNKMENKMIYKWAMHCKQAWEGKMSSIQQDLWQLQSTIFSSSTWEEINTNNSEIIFYTLPIPNYVR